MVQYRECSVVARKDFFMRSRTVLFCMPLLMFTLHGCGVSPTGQNGSSTYGQNLLSAVSMRGENQIDKESEVSINQAADSVSRSIRQLAEIEQANHGPATMPAQPDPIKIGMADRVSVDWTGPVEPLLDKIASATHYKLKILGQASAIPTTVSVHTKNAQIADVLQDIIYQTQNSVDIVRSTKARVIELRYPNA